MLSLISFVLTCITCALASPLFSGECVISIDYKTGDLKEYQPLILERNASTTRFLHPVNDEGTLRIPAQRPIYLACPGKGNYLKNVSLGNEVKAACVKDKIFSINGRQHDFSSLTCDYLPRHDARRTGSRCLGKHSHVKIGFPIANAFVHTLEVCRDDRTYVTYYTKFRMTKAIGNYQRSYPRPKTWISGGFYPGLDLAYLYKLETQIDTVGKILNSTELAKKYIKRSKQYLSRGHLTAKADFVYGALQSSTFWYLNSAPQWQSFNGGNWNNLEVSVRNFASSRRLDLDVYTGVHGQMTMMNAAGKQQPIYLYVNGTDRAIPAPRFYWKVIYDPSSKRGTAFVGLNDPFVKSITGDVYLCPDIGSRINWLQWNPKDKLLGISYACTVDDLRKAVPTVPDLVVKDILM